MTQLPTFAAIESAAKQTAGVAHKTPVAPPRPPDPPTRAERAGGSALARYASDGGSRSSELVLRVPEVLMSGNHAEIRRWRKREALSRTLERRPDLLDAASLDDEEEQLLRELKGASHERD